jgi:hypothetical protein
MLWPCIFKPHGLVPKPGELIVDIVQDYYHETSATDKSNLASLDKWEKQIDLPSK